jgi:hypothetical protein
MRTRRTRTLVAITTVATSLAVTAAAAAVLPIQGKRFAGITSEHAINGFKPSVTCKIAYGGRMGRNFSFETLGCFGHGAFPVGVDPFAETVWHVAKIPVTPTGAFSVTKPATTTTPGSGKLTVTVSGTVASPTKIKGKLVFSQSLEGTECGPQTVKFLATTT